MKQTGIIMSGDHPRKILDGTKTMTRRVIKIKGVDIHDKKWVNAKYNSRYGCCFINDGLRETWSTECPYGQVGDRLWVRETWMLFGLVNTTHAFIHYKANKDENGDERLLQRPLDKPLYPSLQWRPSLFMPRWASRITLEITGLRGERLRQITLADAIAEGFNSIEDYIVAFLRLNHLPEDANPWNWVISFKIV